MRCFWCILLAFCILSCGGNSIGPEPKPKPEPKPEPQYKELSYENLAGFWTGYSDLSYFLGTRADSSFRYIESNYVFFRFYEQFRGKYFLNDPYIGIRGTFSIGRLRENPEDRYYLYLARLTDSIHVRSAVSHPVDVLTLRNVPEASLREILNLPDTTGVTPVVMAMSAEEFASFLDSLKANTRGKIIQADNPFQLIKYRP